MENFWFKNVFPNKVFFTKYFSLKFWRIKLSLKKFKLPNWLKNLNYFNWVTVKLNFFRSIWKLLFVLSYVNFHLLTRTQQNVPAGQSLLGFLTVGLHHFMHAPRFSWQFLLSSPSTDRSKTLKKTLNLSFVIKCINLV